MRQTPLSCTASRHRGFTVIELVVTVTVIAILAAVGVPSLRAFLQNNRNSSQAQSLILGTRVAW